MSPGHKVKFSGPRNIFQERRLPEAAALAGYGALINAYELAVPLPRKLFATGSHHRIVENDAWRIMTPRHAPSADVDGHLTFALKYEGLDLAVLKRLFAATGPDVITDVVRNKPTGSYARRIWFLYEWLTEERLDLPDAEGGHYVAVVDPERQFATEGEKVPRYRVKDNLPGNRDFCPLVFRTPKLEEFMSMDLPGRARAVVADVPRDVLARTAAFLMLKDSRSSYAIEGERPPQNRLQRWGRAIGEAGRQPFDRDELLRLQRIVLGDARFIKPGFRDEGGFVGRHDRETRMPLPDHISARHEDLPSLTDGMIAFGQGVSRRSDPVVAAAVLAFGFVYIHPFEDGNGRLHRYLIHHVLADRGFNPHGVVFPVSAAILERVDEYRTVLESYSARLLPLIEWEPTERFNVRILNDTGDFYRFFDATPHAEFLYACVRKTIEEDLPSETAFLRNYDAFRGQIESIVEMPERTINLLCRFLHQNGGTLSRRARAKEFRALTENEASRIERAYAETMIAGEVVVANND